MSPSHPHTVDVAARSLLGEEDEDNDICPVCIGECTCSNNPRPLHTSYGGSNGYTPNITPTFSNHAPSQTPTPKLPSLKIKLTVPRSLLGKRRASSSSITKSSGKSETTCGAEIAGESSSSSHLDHASTSTAPLAPIPKRRGRPTKAIVAARLAPKTAAEAREGVRLTASSLSQFPSQSQQSVKRKDPLTHRKLKPKSVASRLPSKFKGKTTTVKKSTKRRRVAASESSAYSSGEDSHYQCEDDDDADSVQFPTFLSASALSGSSSSSSDSESSSLTDFDSDSSIEAEEEHYIIAEESKAHDKARVRRELLGEDSQRRRNDWVIRPRKMSVGPSDAEMEVDSDATEDEEDEEEEQEEDEEDETDGRAPSVVYAGVATGWSDGEESSFDADLFFANLSSDSDSTDSSAAGDEGADDVEDGEHSDVDAISLVQAAAAGIIPQLRQELNNLPFEVTQGWDGQIIFTNGIQDGHGILDIDFEVNAAQLVVETSASPSATSTDMATSDIGDADNGDESVVDDGTTTDEDLVGADDLPNERAMQLFIMPMSVSAIDPMSTLSPVGSPHPINRRRFRSSSHCESPKPADILAGKVFWEDSDGDFEDNLSKSRGESSSRGGLPRTGTFQLSTSDRRVVIDGSNKDVPSPHPRAGRIGRGRNLTQSLHGSHMFDSPWSARSYNRTSSVPPSTRSHTRGFSSECSMALSSDNHLTEPVNLDDVLDSSYLDSDGSDCHGSTTSVNDSDSKKHIKSLKRWDVISVGAFRQSHSSMGSIDSTAGWSSDVPHGGSATDTISNVMKSNPMNAMLWNNKDSKADEPSSGASSPSSSRRQKRGDRTPTNYVPSSAQQQQNRFPPKTRKELKQEHKLKRKSFGAAHHKHPHHQYHTHHHHPNMKSRSSGSVQRTNFFSSSTSSPM